MNKLPARTVVSFGLIQAVLLLGVCRYARASSVVYELSVKAWAGPGFEGEVLQIHQLVQPDLPFSFITNGQQGHLSVTGTLSEESPDHFYLEITNLDAFGMSTSGRLCDSQETKERWQAMKAIGLDIHHDDDPPEGDFGCVAIYGPAFQMNLKQAQPDPHLTIASSQRNVILAWPTNSTGFTLQSTTDLDPAIWTTNFPAPVVVNGQFTVTNPISGNQQFFRLAQ